jgi:hypothetical protein
MMNHDILWRRLDFPGHEACRLQSAPSGWRLAGTAVFFHERQACRLSYIIECDVQWLTRSAVVSGWMGSRDVDVEVVRDPSGAWRLDGGECVGVLGCTDIDLNFSPSTNLLPIRRLDLAIGEAAAVRAAWLRFPSFALEPLEQSYERLAEDAYRYDSAGGRFVARIDVDPHGFPTDYAGLWVREDAG